MLADPRADELSKMVAAIQQAIVNVDPDGTGRGGYIDHATTMTALLTVIADLTVKAGHHPTPRDTRLFGERLGKGVVVMIKSFRAAEAHGESSNMQVKPAGKLN